MKPKGEILLLLLIALLSPVPVASSTCGTPFEGEFLEDFHGPHSYLSYLIDERYMRESSLSYQDRFCTKNGSGIIAQLTSSNLKEDIIIEVVKGHVAVQLLKNHILDPECIFHLNKEVTDGSSFLFKIELEGKELSMTLFSRYTKIYSISVTDISMCLDGIFSGFTFIEKGGHKVNSLLAEGAEAQVEEIHQRKPYLYGDFDGCIGDSILNGIPVAQAGKEMEKHDIDPTCSHSFGSECTDVCATSYIVVESDKCACPRDSAMNDVGMCAESCSCITCQNGGTCNTKSGSDAICECPRDYVGKYCETKIDYCKGFNCQNGGSCIVQASVPSCTCLLNFTGIQCEVFIPPEDPCDGVHCDNNATCESNTALEKKYSCSCLPGYSGEFCEFTQENSDNKKIYWIVGSVLFAIVGGLIFLVGAIFRLKEKREKDGSQESLPPNTAS